MEKSMSAEVRVPELGESIVDAVVGVWQKHEGDAVQQGDGLVELETDKVNLEVSAEQSGVLQKILKQEGDVVTVGEAIGMIGEQAEASTSAAGTGAINRAPTSGAVQQAPASTDGKRSPSPLARRIAEEHNVDLSQVPGSSQYGRVTKDDVIHYLEQQTQPAQPAPAASAASQVQTAPSPGRAAPTQTPTPAPV